MNSASSGVRLSSDIDFLLCSEQRLTMPFHGIAVEPITGAMPRFCQGSAAPPPPAIRHPALGLVSIAQLAGYYRAMLLASALARFIAIGRLSVIDAAGKRHVFEGAAGPSATIRLHDPKLHWKLLLRPRLFVPEAYMAGKLTVEEGSLYDFIEILVSSDAAQATALPVRLGQAA